MFRLMNCPKVSWFHRWLLSVRSTISRKKWCCTLLTPKTCTALHWCNQQPAWLGDWLHEKIYWSKIDTHGASFHIVECEHLHSQIPLVQILNYDGAIRNGSQCLQYYWLNTNKTPIFWHSFLLLSLIVWNLSLPFMTERMKKWEWTCSLIFLQPQPACMWSAFSILWLLHVSWSQDREQVLKKSGFTTLMSFTTYVVQRP